MKTETEKLQTSVREQAEREAHKQRIDKLRIDENLESSWRIKK